MMQKVRIVDPGDTKFLEGDYVDKNQLEDENEGLMDNVVVMNKGDSKLKNGQLMSKKNAREVNSDLKKKAKKVSNCAMRTGDIGTDSAWDHASVAYNGQLDFGSLVPGNDQSADRCGDRRKDRSSAWSEGKRHHGTPDSGGNRDRRSSRILWSQLLSPYYQRQMKNILRVLLYPRSETKKLKRKIKIAE